LKHEQANIGAPDFVIGGWKGMVQEKGDEMSKQTRDDSKQDGLDAEVSIGVWAESLISELKKFCDHWVHGEETQPDLFPETMNPGDWDDQFEIWLGANKDLDARR